MKEKADIGMIGLAVMGENLALNMESRGFTVAVYNRTVPEWRRGSWTASSADAGRARTLSVPTRSRTSCRLWQGRAGS